MTAVTCPACLGDAHTNCTGVEATPCACGCLTSAASLHRSTLRSLRSYNQPQYTDVTRRINSMRHDGKQVD